MYFQTNNRFPKRIRFSFKYPNLSGLCPQSPHRLQQAKFTRFFWIFHFLFFAISSSYGPGWIQEGIRQILFLSSLFSILVFFLAFHFKDRKLYYCRVFRLLCFAIQVKRFNHLCLVKGSKCPTHITLSLFHPWRQPASREGWVGRIGTILKNGPFQVHLPEEDNCINNHHHK